MGCDIHMYVEYLYDEKERPDYWRSLGGRVNPGRNYELFGLLANVRDDESPALYEPRGLPAHMGFHSEIDSSLYVIDGDKTDDDGCCTRSDAVKWVKSGSSKWVDDSKKRVTHPDWHSHSWLTTAEFEAVLWHEAEAVEYHAVLASMKYLESKGHKARVVFWFDN